MSSLAFLPIILLGAVALLPAAVSLVVELRLRRRPVPKPARPKPKLVLIQGGKQLAPVPESRTA